MKKYKKRLLIFIIINIIIYSYILIQRNSFVWQKYSYVNEYIINEDIVGSISIESLNINDYLLQGMDDLYYLDKDENKNINNYGSIFIGYQTNLNKEQINYLYIPYKDNYILSNKDIININYLGNNINYIIVNKKNNNSLIIKYYKDKKIINEIYANKI